MKPLGDHGGGERGMSIYPVNQPGSLTCVGLGMLLGAHLGPRARSCIEQADVVFAAASDPVVEQWLRGMNPGFRSLQPHYAEGKERQSSYREMAGAMLAELRQGRRVCGAFYGHPGVFAQVSHAAIAEARAEGYAAHMEPGISAEDCLYADLGIDPGRFGCQHYEASQLLFYRRRIDPSAYLVLWQVGVAGDSTYRRFESDAAHRALLVERLVHDYPADHPVLLYEAATLPIMKPRVENLRLEQIPNVNLSMQSTLVIPPCQPMERNEEMLARARALDSKPASGEAEPVLEAVP